MTLYIQIENVLISRLFKFILIFKESNLEKYKTWKNQSQELLMANSLFFFQNSYHVIRSIDKFNEIEILKVQKNRHL